MKSYRKELTFRAKIRRAYLNITPRVKAALAESGNALYQAAQTGIDIAEWNLDIVLISDSNENIHHLAAPSAWTLRSNALSERFG